MRARKIGVLLTGMGGSAAVELITSLRATGRYRVIAVDASPYAAGYAVADSHHIIPFASDPDFADAFRKVLIAERPDFVIPLVDEEILAVNRIVREEFGGAMRVVGPSVAFSELTMDKWRATAALKDAGVPVPDSWLAGDASGASFPAIIKPRSGRGSRGLAYLSGPGDLSAYLEEAESDADEYIVQKRIVGTEYTVSVVAGLDGRLIAVVPKEVLVKRGITQAGVTRNVPAIDAVCRTIHDRLEPAGPFNVQLMLSRDDVPYVFEINPRYSTTTTLTIAAGVNEVDLVISDAMGGKIENVAFTPDLMMVRHYTSMYLPAQDWPKRLDSE